jgi:hypothetical protein
LPGSVITRRGGSDGRGAQVNFRFWVAHSAFEIAVGGGQGDFAIAEGALVDAQTWPAAGVHHDSAGVHEHTDVAFAECLPVNRARSREDEHSGTGGDLMSLQNPGGKSDVIEAPIGAGTDDDLIDFPAGDFLYRLNIIDGVRAGNLRLQFRNVEIHDTFESGVGIRDVAIQIRRNQNIVVEGTLQQPHREGIDVGLIHLDIRKFGGDTLGSFEKKAIGRADDICFVNDGDLFAFMLAREFEGGANDAFGTCCRVDLAGDRILVTRE